MKINKIQNSLYCKNLNKPLQFKNKEKHISYNKDESNMFKKILKTASALALAFLILGAIWKGTRTKMSDVVVFNKIA